MITAAYILRTPVAIVGAALFMLGCGIIDISGYPPECGQLCRPGFWESVNIRDVETELEGGANINGAKGYDLNSPLHLAIDHNVDAAIVELMLEKGADPNESGYKIFYGHHGGDDWWKSHRTPLQLAVEQGSSPAIIRLLLEHGADPNPPTHHDSEDESPLFYATRLWYEGHHSIISLLLEHGADINAKSHYGLTPLHRAMYEADPSVIAMLLDHGADIHARTIADNYQLGGSLVTPLHLAAESNPHLDSISLLLDYGADVNAKARHWETPLHMASSYNYNLGVVSLLLERGADVNANTTHWETPLHWAIKHRRNPAVIPLLLDHGANVNVRNTNGLTPLHMAGDDVELISLLLVHGANANAKTVRGVTLLHTIMWGGNSEAITLLLDHGADVNAKTEIINYSPALSYATPLHWAISNGSTPEAVALLIRRGADINIKDQAGMTPCEKAKELDWLADIRPLLCQT